MARLSEANVRLALEIIGRYPRPRSALIPVLHIAQAQDGYVSSDAMRHVAELVGTTPSEVLSTCSFYEMFKRSRPGAYQLNICRGISCFLRGADDLIERATERLGIPLGGTAPHCPVSLEAVECVAACTEAPCAQVNYRYFGPLGASELDELIDGLEAGRLAELPPHGVLSTVLQSPSPDRLAGPSMPEDSGPPAWWERRQERETGKEAG